MTLVAYTTLYRTGGARLQQAARTLARERGGVAVATETKRAFVDAVTAQPLDELHLVSHSGMYGPMFGTTDLPEQFSPHEWRTLDIPWRPGARAYFHACRTGRWFAPFFARTQGVVTHGHHWYTTVSTRPDAYRWVPSWRHDDPIYIVGQPGRKSHGLPGSVGKHLGLLPPQPMLRFEPQDGLDEPAYDAVADLYDRVFDDIRVRGPEWEWLSARVPRDARVLDVGCGTGALLRALEPAGAIGVDVSSGMLDAARRKAPQHTFHQLDGPRLPVPDNSVDVVTSLLSWRYVDWDPMLAEVARVLVNGGRLLLVDMVASPATVPEWPRMLAHKVRERRHLRDFPGYREARAQLVQHSAWARMLKYNPIRAEHEYRWFFESRFPGRTVQTLDIGRQTRVLAFDSGPVTASWFPPQSYP